MHWGFKLRFDGNPTYCHAAEQALSEYLADLSTPVQGPTVNSAFSVASELPPIHTV